MKTTILRICILALLTGSTLSAIAVPPTAHNISMPTIVQASNLLPLDATAVNTDVVMYTIETIPAESTGTLYLSMNGIPMAVSAGMMLSADLAGNLSFDPNPDYTGTVEFTYSATDGNMEVSNTATYSIPVIGQQAVILPVRLMNFNGSLQQHTARLFWQTSQETEGCYYELQRSTDGTRFVTIATVTGKGKEGTQDYTETDDLFLLNVRQVYYRIRMVEVNGHARYSQQILLTPATRGSNLKAWPVPFQGQLQVAYQSETNETVSARVTAANGAVVKQFRLTARQGNNQWQLQQLNQLPSGNYILTIEAGGKMSHLPVMKQ